MQELVHATGMKAIVIIVLKDFLLHESTLEIKISLSAIFLPDFTNKMFRV
jgi:hypothetical protein